MVAGVGEITDVVRSSKLRVHHDPVLWKVREAQQISSIEHRNGIQPVRKRTDIVVGKVATRARECPKRGGSRNGAAVDGTETEIETLKYLIEQWGVIAALCNLKGIHQAVFKDVHFVQVHTSD